MRENNRITKADLKKENQQPNLIRTVRENSRTCKESSNIKKISECENTGLPSKTAEPAPGYQILIRTN